MFLSLSLYIYTHIYSNCDHLHLPYRSRYLYTHWRVTIVGYRSRALQIYKYIDMSIFGFWLASAPFQRRSISTEIQKQIYKYRHIYRYIYIYKGPDRRQPPFTGALDAQIYICRYIQIRVVAASATFTGALDLWTIDLDSIDMDKNICTYSGSDRRPPPSAGARI